MSVLTITEYASLVIAQVGGVNVQVPQEPPIAEQAITIAASSTACAAFNAQTTLVRLNVDGTAACAVTFGTAPTATTPSAGAGSGRVSANATEFRGVVRGQSYKLAVIATT